MSRETTDTFDFLSNTEPPLRDDFFNRVVKQLAHFRRLKGLTQDKLGHRLGFADRLINKWECGTRLPSGFSLWCWTDALDCELMVVPKKLVKKVKEYIEDENEGT